jgi:hypothetical protein
VRARTVRAAIDRELAGDALIFQPACGADEVVVAGLALRLDCLFMPGIAVFGAAADAGDGEDALERLEPGREEWLPSGLCVAGSGRNPVSNGHTIGEGQGDRTLRPREAAVRKEQGGVRPGEVE